MRDNPPAARRVSSDLAQAERSDRRKASGRSREGDRSGKMEKIKPTVPSATPKGNVDKFARLLETPTATDCGACATQLATSTRFG
jgi:hypothetical protein